MGSPSHVAEQKGIMWFAPIWLRTSSQWREQCELDNFFANSSLKKIVNAIWVPGYCDIKQKGDIHKLPAATELWGALAKLY